MSRLSLFRSKSFGSWKPWGRVNCGSTASRGLRNPSIFAVYFSAPNIVGDMLVDYSSGITRQRARRALSSGSTSMRPMTLSETDSHDSRRRDSEPVR